MATILSQPLQLGRKGNLVLIKIQPRLKIVLTVWTSDDWYSIPHQLATYCISMFNDEDNIDF